MGFRIVFSSLLLVVLATASAQNLRLPDFGDPSQQYISGSQERQLGAQVFQRLRSRGAVIEDVQLNEYLNSIGQRLASYANSGHPYTFFWLDADSINAFAAPGGYIGVHSGLLLATRDESELAGVVAHEVAHVSQRHIARQYADAKRFSLPMAAAMLASIALAAATEGGRAGQAALAGVMAADSQRKLNMTRGNEQEADRIGYQFLGSAGFDPEGMTHFFEYLQRLSGDTAARIPEFLLTHPRPSSRVTDTQNRVTSSGVRRRSPTGRTYYLAKARAKVLTTANATTLISHFRDTLAKGGYKNEQAERYGYALALKRAGRYDEAQRQIARLLKKTPDNLAFRIEQAEIALARGERKQAWSLFAKAHKLFPDDFTLAVHYGRALAAQGDPRQAMKVLKPFLRRRPREVLLYELYGQAAQRAGDSAGAHAALAEYYYISGDIQGAIEQAELGLRRGGNTPYEQARLQARLRQLQKQAGDQ